MNKEYPLAPPWISVMLEENPLIRAHRVERERLRMEELIAMQQQMNESENLVIEHMKVSATPDPYQRFRELIDSMCED